MVYLFDNVFTKYFCLKDMTKLKQRQLKKSLKINFATKNLLLGVIPYVYIYIFIYIYLLKS